MFSVIKMTVHRIRQTRITSMFFIFGMVFSMLLVSVGISFSYEYIHAAKTKSGNAPPNGEVYGFYSKGGKRISRKNMAKLFDGMREETGVIISNLLVHPDRAEINTYCPLSAEWFVQDEGWHYPLKEGRYYTAEEIKNGEKVALIGSMLEENIREDAGKQYIDIYGEAYEVLGIVGTGDQASLWDNRVFIPCTSLPEQLEADVTFSSVQIILYNESGGLDKDQNVIRQNGASMVSGFKVKDEGPIQNEDMAQILMQGQDPIYLLTLMGYVVTLIYAVNIVVFWLEKRRYEIGLRKAFGYTDKDIAILIFGEMFGLTLFSCIIALAVQMAVGRATDRILGYTMKLHVPNIIIALGVVLLTAVLTSIWPVRRAMRIPPADTIKGGGTV